MGTPSILISGGMHPFELREAAAIAGCVDYLAKPFKVYDLAWRIAKALGSEVAHA